MFVRRSLTVAPKLNLSTSSSSTSSSTSSPFLPLISSSFSYTFSSTSSSSSFLPIPLPSFSSRSFSTTPPTPTPSSSPSSPPPSIDIPSSLDGLTPQSLERVNSALSNLLSLSLFEGIYLVKQLEKKWGVSSAPVGFASAGAAPAAAAPAAAVDAKAEKKEEVKVAEKIIFTVKLESFNAADKIKVIKEVRAATGLGLKESKDLVEGAPKVVKAGMNKADSDALIAKLKEAGAKVSVE